MVGLVPPHLDVALVPPVLTPAVLHQPVVVVGVGVIAVSHRQYTVVKVLRAAHGIVVNTLAVEHEAVLAGIDGNGGGPHASNNGLQRVLITRLDINEAVVNAADVGCLEGALVPILSVPGSVGVTLL